MKPHVLCFGEILWDLFPHGHFLGGAPLNVAYHLSRLGCDGRLVSAVGRDQLGHNALAAMAMAGLSAGRVGVHASLPTGTAVVQLDALGQARFTLPQPVAWDEIPADTPAGARVDAIVFGTLALRGPANRTALRTLLDASPDAWCVCDVNLRPPFDDLDPLWPLLERADLLKVNADEALRLGGFKPEDKPAWPDVAARITRRFPRALLCITLGADGAGLFVDGCWLPIKAEPVVVRDTVGAGDAFTAALVAGRLRASGAPAWERILRTASRLGGFVASRDGAQPDYGGFDPGL
ncbi:MAG TPA: PfkB family carbohydrate kinase [Opitutaceae bacterium]